MGEFAARPDIGIAELRAQRITHVVIGEPGSIAPNIPPAMRALVAERPSYFVQEYANPTFTVYRFGASTQ
jgi:hypothetical protein